MDLQNKTAIYNNIIEHLNRGISEAQIILQNTIEARDNESKSTAGDKYETGRAMMQIEQQQNEIQLNKLIIQKAQLQQINISTLHQTIVLGSLVSTNFGVFFLSIPFGKVNYLKQDVYVISLASPLGKQFLNKKQNDTFTFLEKKYIIREFC